MVKRPNNPKDKVRELQRTLWACAKQKELRRFHALYDRIWRDDILRQAWKRVKANAGASGIDGVTVDQIQQSGVNEFLKGIQTCLREGRYRPMPVRRRYIPKPGGKIRPLGIPTLKDRVVQMATKIVIEPIFEADFLPVSYGFRPKRSATQALEAIRQYGNQGYNDVVDVDIQAYFDHIDHKKLMEFVAKRISDRKVQKLIRQWLKAGVMEEKEIKRTFAGTPQGGVISPLLSNIYLHAFDSDWLKDSNHLGKLVRYADDFVVMCKKTSQAKEAAKRLKANLKSLGLEPNMEKTHLVNLAWGKESLTFLGCVIRKKRSIQRAPHLRFMQRWPSPKATKSLRQRVKLATQARGNRSKNVRELIDKLSPVLRGWSNYFKTGNAQREFNRADSYVYLRILRWEHRRRGQRSKLCFKDWPAERLYQMGLHRLQGTITYPAQATPRRPSVSRVRENRTHGLKGGFRKPASAMTNGA